MLLAQGAAATAAEVNVMAGNALAGMIGELGPQFERATGHKLVMQFGLSRTFKPQIEAVRPSTSSSFHLKRLIT